MKSLYGPVMFIPQIFPKQSKLVCCWWKRKLIIVGGYLVPHWLLLSHFTSKIQADNPIWDTWLVELIRSRDIICIRPHGSWYLCYQYQHLDTTWVDPQSPSIGMLMSSFTSLSHQAELDSCSNYIIFNEHWVVNLKGPFLKHCQKQKPWIFP